MSAVAACESVTAAVKTDPSQGEVLRLFNENRGLARYGLKLLDLPRIGRGGEHYEQEALLALWRAARRYDPDRGVKFSSYSVPAILHALRRARRWQRSPIPFSSMTLPDGSPFDVEDERPAPDLAEAHDEARLALRYLRFLPPRWREVVARRFGVEGYHRHRFSDIADAMSISPARAQQVFERAMTRLRARAQAGQRHPDR